MSETLLTVSSHFSEHISLLLLWQIAVTIALMVFTGIAIHNIIHFPTIKRRTLNQHNNVEEPTPELTRYPSYPKVSICVPARNEERMIAQCVESLCKQDYPSFEVIVLDDNSTDETPAILAELVKKYPNTLITIKGKPLEKGWIGKPYACHQLSQVATGEILLFTDADTIHIPEMLTSAVHFADERNADFFSMIPNEVMETWGEQLVLPLVHYLYFAYLPNKWITDKKAVKYSAANGQFMFFKRDTYEAIGGHTSVKNNLVEDVFLAKEVKKSGRRILLANGYNLVKCRMYENMTEVFKGFSKNFFAGMSFSLPMMALFQLHFLALFVLPFVLVIYSLFTQEFSVELLYLPLFQYSLSTLIRLLITLRFKMPLLQAFLHPISVLFGMAIGINSVRWAYSSIGSQWKGRAYQKDEVSV
jgi:chlorobactene glucosyltransferase